MRLKSLFESWNREEVDRIWPSIQRVASNSGFTAQIVGSVSKSGHSDKDLDILLTPVDDEFDYENFIEGLSHLGIHWIGDASDEENEVETFHTSDGKVIDIFIGEFSEDHKIS